MSKHMMQFPSHNTYGLNVCMYGLDMYACTYGLDESCSDLSPNGSLMSCITFSKRSQPMCVPKDLGCTTFSYPIMRTGTLYEGIMSCGLFPDKVSLVFKLHERLVEINILLLT